MRGVEIIKRPRLKKPYLVVAWPGMGEVAFRAAVYLTEQLKAEEFAQIPAKDFFYLTSNVVHNGCLAAPELPQSRFYYYKNKEGANDLIIFISDAQPDLTKAESYSKKIIYIAKQFNVEMVVSFASMPVPIEHTQDSGVWFVPTLADMKNNFKKYNFNLLSEGQVSGMNGLFLGIAKKNGLKGFCLLGEIPLYTIQMENPKASYSVLSALCRILNIKLDFTNLVSQAHSLEGEINKLLDYLKLGVQAAGPIGEEEIDKIKRALASLPKLPVSVKDKIEKLFTEAKLDVAKSNALKEELDKWNVYKDYEDRFLDLFKKAKENP